MAKSDYPALLAPGVHALTISELHAIAVAPFPSDLQRQSLFAKLTKWANALQAVGLSGTMWLDGSFLTEKIAPGDVDCVLWNPKWLDPNTITNEVQSNVTHLLDHATARAIYDLDLYVINALDEEVLHQEAYWKGFFGYCHDRVTAKGFAEVQL
jgi:hypothetical protein